MRILRVLAAASIVAGAALGFAGPAQADQVIQGVYNYTEADGTSGTWQVWPSCVPTVGDLREPLALPVACRLHVLSSNGVSGDAKLTGGVWTLEANVFEGMECSDGTFSPTTQTVKFDDRTMSGTRSIFATGCEELPSKTDIPFTLSFKEPLPGQVDQYPLICEPGGLRRCF